MKIGSLYFAIYKYMMGNDQSLEFYPGFGSYKQKALDSALQAVLFQGCTIHDMQYRIVRQHKDQDVYEFEYIYIVDKGWYRTYYETACDAWKAIFRKCNFTDADSADSWPPDVKYTAIPIVKRIG